MKKLFQFTNFSEIDNVLLPINRRINLLFIEANLDGTVGGSHYCLLEIISKIDRNKFVPSVVFYEPNSLESEFTKLCPVYVFNRHNRLSFSRLLHNNFGRSMIISLFFGIVQKVLNLILFTLPDFVKILLFLRRKKINLIHLNNAPYLSDWLIASKMLRVKCTAHLRGHWKPLPTFFHRILIKHYDAVVAISRSVKEWLDNHGIKTKNFVIIYDGINPDLYNCIFSKNMIDFHHTALGFERIIGIVGNIKPWKGQHVLIQAINIIKKTMPNIKCFIIGDIGQISEDKNYYIYLTKLVKQFELEENIFFTGYQKDVLKLITNFEVLVHTSIEPEPLGRVILEGMLIGKPVIATAHGGPLEIIEHGDSGLLVPPNDPVVLAQTLLALLYDTSLQEKIGRQARRRVLEGFDLKDKVIELESLFEKVISEA